MKEFSDEELAKRVAYVLTETIHKGANYPKSEMRAEKAFIPIIVKATIEILRLGERLTP